MKEKNHYYKERNQNNVRALTYSSCHNKYLQAKGKTLWKTHRMKERLTERKEERKRDFCCREAGLVFKKESSSLSHYWLTLDLWLAKDNRFLNPKSSYKRILMAPPCRLIVRLQLNARLEAINNHYKRL